jgi:hypothetical protein
MMSQARMHALIKRNINKIKGGYCPESSWSWPLRRTWLYYVALDHKMDSLSYFSQYTASMLKQGKIYMLTVNS